MHDYELTENLYVLPTPAGAFYAVSGIDSDPVRRLLLATMRHEASLELTEQCLGDCLQCKDHQANLETLYRAQSLALLQGFREPQQLSTRSLAEGLAELLPGFSSLGKSLLVDWNGLSLGQTGLDAETADMLCALSADLIAVQGRHAERLATTLGLGNQGWAAVDTYGSSRIGAWPLFIGPERFMLVLLGEPCLNRPEFVSLIWMLMHRYG